MEKLNHVDRCLKKAEEYEKAGDKEKAQYWLDKADEVERKMKDLKKHNIKIEQQKKIGGYNA